MLIAIFILAAVGVTGVYVFFPWFVRNILRRHFRDDIRDCHGFSITFDDGPDPEVTPTILDILLKHNAHATFFVVGKKVKQHPLILQRIISEGHQIAFHSYGHKHPYLTGPLGTFLDIRKGQRSCTTDQSEGNLSFFRPPYGKLNLVSLLYVWLKKWKVIFWSFDPKDYLISSSQDLVDKILKNLSDGSVVLLHDGRTERKLIRNNELLTGALDKVLTEAHSRGLKPRTVCDLLKHKEPLSKESITPNT